MSEKLTNMDPLPSVMETGDLLYVVRSGMWYKADFDDLPSGGGGAISSVFTRTGAVVAAIGDYTENQVLGTTAENLTLTGAENISLSDFTDKYLVLTGNTTITFTDTPSSGQSIVRTYLIESDTTETLGIANSTAEINSYVADGTVNEVTVKASNYSTKGLKISVYFSQPN